MLPTLTMAMLLGPGTVVLSTYWIVVADRFGNDHSVPLRVPVTIMGPKQNSPLLRGRMRYWIHPEITSRSRTIDPRTLSWKDVIRLVPPGIPAEL